MSAKSTERVSAETLAKLHGLQLRTARVLDGLLQGLHRSPHQGSSIEYAEHRDYTPGDDLRHIDWRALARLDKVYVKVYEAETNLQAWILLDTSESMAYGRPGLLTKFEYASLLATSLSLILLRQQDASGLVLFDEAVHTMIPSRATVSHLQRLCDALDKARPSGHTRLSAGVDRLGRLASRRGLVVVLSDFFGDIETCMRGLKRLRAAGHDVLVLQTLDDDELTFPFEGTVLFEGLEQKERLLVEPRLVRQTYLEQLNAHIDAVREACLADGIRHMLVNTHEEPIVQIRRILVERSGRG